MKEIKNYLTNNDCYKSGKKMTSIKGVLVHSTAAPGATTESFKKNWNTAKPGGRQVCVHAFIDDNQIINTLPYNYKCWGCGGSGNENYIQIEICEPASVYFENGWKYKCKDIKELKVYMSKVKAGLIEFIVNRLYENGITVVNEKTVTSHYEGYKMGIASNHGDPAGLFGLVDFSMDELRRLCKEAMKEKLKGSKEDKNNKEEKVNEKKEEKGAKERLVKITADSLNIRTGAGTSYKKVEV